MDIIKILSNFTIQDILIIILILIIIYLIFKPLKNEQFEARVTPDVNTNVTPDMIIAINNAVQSQIQLIYDLDVEAMRNLGAISKSILTGTDYIGINPNGGTTPGTLTIPANLRVMGSITYAQTSSPTGTFTIGSPS